VKTTRVLLVDDHQLVRAGFRSLLKRIRAAKVVAEASNGREAVELVERHQPDVVLMDIAMPRLNGLEAIAFIRKKSPHTKVIVLSMHSSEEHVMQALFAGASGYLIKDAAVDELGQAIRAVTTGKTYFSRQISERAIDTYLTRIDVSPVGVERLTPRQREVMQLIAEGHNTKEIASLLKLSPKTVEAHRAQLMRRLGIDDIPSLVRQAMRSGLVPPEASLK
jgi:DNA-binding NarL/FixJ family response regulator